MQRLPPEDRHRNHHRGIREPEDPDRFSEGVPNLELRDDIRITDTAPIVRRMEDSDRPRDIHPAERVSVLAALSLVDRKAVVPVTAPDRPRPRGGKPSSAALRLLTVVQEKGLQVIA